MTDPIPGEPSNPSQRRPRYAGTHPRHFRDKYKEHQPQRYADDVAKIVASGKTPAGSHRPVLLTEVLAALKPQPGQIVADVTLGYGGHAAALLEAVQPGGRLYAIDTDPLELPKTAARLRQMPVPEQSIVVARSNYAGFAKWIAPQVPAGADMILADLGCSSMQLDNPDRGFSYKLDGPLDMRLNPEHGQSVEAMLLRLEPAELAAILRDNSDEPHANKLAAAILKAHHGTRLTTRTLANLIRATVAPLPHAVGEHPDDSIPRVFQALRIAVNDEFSALETFLGTAPYCLKSGGRIAVISFHSGEDRRVKAAFKSGLKDGTYASVSLELITASAEERRSNPRSKSAKLRWAVRS